VARSHQLPGSNTPVGPLDEVLSVVVAASTGGGVLDGDSRSRQNILVACTVVTLTQTLLSATRHASFQQT